MSRVRQMTGPARDRAFGYRSELDGLRAIAVLTVVVFHSRGGVFPGGYIGVDVFFVLSGYLITSLLMSEHGRNGRISFRRFYARRALRLLPALLLVCAVVLFGAGFAAIDGYLNGTTPQSVVSAYFTAVAMA